MKEKPLSLTLRNIKINRPYLAPKFIFSIFLILPFFILGFQFLQKYPLSPYYFYFIYTSFSTTIIASIFPIIFLRSQYISAYNSLKENNRGYLNFELIFFIYGLLIIIYLVYLYILIIILNFFWEELLGFGIGLVSGLYISLERLDRLLKKLEKSDSVLYVPKLKNNLLLIRKQVPIISAFKLFGINLEKIEKDWDSIFGYFFLGIFYQLYYIFFIIFVNVFPEKYYNLRPFFDNIYFFIIFLGIYYAISTPMYILFIIYPFKNLNNINGIAEELQFHLNEIIRMINPVDIKVIEELVKKYKLNYKDIEIDEYGYVISLSLCNKGLKNIPQIIENLSHLKILEFYYNQIKKIEALDKLPQLEELYLNWNQITEIEGLKNLSELQILSLTRNRINKIKNLEPLLKLKSLILDNNQIEIIEGLEDSYQLKVLGLAENQISKIRGLDNLSELENLTLDNNKITKIENLDELVKLKELSLAINQISKIEGLDNLSNLEYLLLNNNQITKIVNLENLSKLKVLDLGNNLIEKIEGIENLNELEDLNLDYNPLSEENQTTYIKKK